MIGTRAGHAEGINMKTVEICKHTFAFGLVLVVAFAILQLTGCTDKSSVENYGISVEYQEEGREKEDRIAGDLEPEIVESAEGDVEREKTEINTEKGESLEILSADKDVETPQFIEIDWSEYFQGCNGAAVLYDASNGQMYVYHKALAEKQSSPCSTFKIISSLTALENGIVDPDNGVRKWSGEVYWNQDWNHDIDFYEAFRTSCVWYFRKIINEIGKEQMQEALDALSYGNCDISDWEGRLNTNNNNRALTGFWLESSLKISPKEQAEVMERIFGSNTAYSQHTLETLKKAMLTTGYQEEDITIYGKTGMGKLNGITVDAWYTGLAEYEIGTVYFCVYLGESDKAEDAETGSDQANKESIEVTSAFAKEIAIAILRAFRFSNS